MNIDEFEVDGEFSMSGRTYRCTDRGSRVVVAIRVDEATVTTTRGGVAIATETIGRDAAEAGGWFSGPPYGVPEVVIDEDDMPACQAVRRQA